MTLTIEDGTGIAGADSFATLAEWVVFDLAYFGDALTGADPLKEAAMRRAFGYLRSLNWIADFPTFGGTIPDAVKEAQMIFARAELAGANALQPSVTEGQSKVLVGAGSLSFQVTGSRGVNAQRQTVTMAMDRLKGLLMSGDSVTFLDRA